MMTQRYNQVILIDGVCNFCVKSAQILDKLEPEGLLKFASQQSEVGQQILEENGYPNNQLNTIFYLEDGQLYEKSEAFLMFSKYLKQPYKFLGQIAKFLPSCLRNHLYDFIAKHRYRIFGTRDVCYLPDPESSLAKRFID